MFPQMAGKLEIPSITFKGIVVQENPNVDPFEAFFNGGSGYVEVKKEINQFKSQKLKQIYYLRNLPGSLVELAECRCLPRLIKKQ